VSDNADELTILRSLLLELDLAVGFREQSVITANTDIAAGVESRATLANDDVACYDLLATVDFDA